MNLPTKLMCYTRCLFYYLYNIAKFRQSEFFYFFYLPNLTKNLTRDYKQEKLKSNT